MNDIVLIHSNDLTVSLRTGVVTTHIIIAPTDAGFALAYLLDPTLTEHLDASAEEIVLPYTPEVDQRVRRLYDLTASIRLTMPGIVQLGLTFNPLPPTA